MVTHQRWRGFSQARLGRWLALSIVASGLLTTQGGKAADDLPPMFRDAGAHNFRIFVDSRFEALSERPRMPIRLRAALLDMQLQGKFVDAEIGMRGVALHGATPLGEETGLAFREAVFDNAGKIVDAAWHDLTFEAIISHAKANPAGGRPFVLFTCCSDVLAERLAVRTGMHTVGFSGLLNRLRALQTRDATPGHFFASVMMDGRAVTFRSRLSDVAETAELMRTGWFTPPRADIAAFLGAPHATVPNVSLKLLGDRFVGIPANMLKRRMGLEPRLGRGAGNVIKGLRWVRKVVP